MEKKLILGSLFLSSSLWSQSITDIQFLNLSKISPAIAEETAALQVGDQIDQYKINEAVKKFYKFGYFNNINVENNNGAIIFNFTEKPSIAQIDIVGYKSRQEDIDALISSMGLRKGNMYSIKRANTAKEALLNELKKEGYNDSVVEVTVEELNSQSVALTFNVNKGQEIIIQNVNYNGAENLDAGDFEPVTANKEKDFIAWWIGNDGELKLDQLEYDHLRIQQKYLEEGFLDVKVKEPFLKVDFNSSNADLDFFIDEGVQYRVGKVTIYVDESIIKAEELYPELLLKSEKVFNVKRLQKDQTFIKTQVANQGYAYAVVKYDIQKNPESGTADLVYSVLPGEKVYIRDVIITGNARTLDRVIRRNVYLAPRDLYNETDYTDSLGSLQRTGFFENSQIEQKRVDASTMDLIVKVQETQTGTLMIGGGYGSYDGLMVNAAINDRNVFGSGLNLGLSVDWSKRQQDFSISLANPSINDSEYSGTIAAYSKTQEIDYEAYDLEKHTLGFSIGAGKALNRYTRVGATYKVEKIDENYSEILNPILFDRDDTDYIHSSITPYITFNNTDDYYQPRSGMIAKASVEYAGLGGDTNYATTSLSYKFFYGLEDMVDMDWIFRYKANLSMISDMGYLPEGSSLYMGGPKSLRGYKSYAFGPEDDSVTSTEAMKKNFTNSVELTFPLSDAAKMRWGLFYDYGMIGENNFTDIKRSGAGGMIEWQSPIGPLQLIFAQPLDDEDGDETSTFEFNLGGTF